MKASSPKAFKLMMDGALAFADMEDRGMRVDVPYLERMIEKTGLKIQQLEEQLKSHEVYDAWRKTYGSKINTGSHQQLGKILFDVMKYPCTKRTQSGRPATDISVLETIDLPFVTTWVNIEKLKKLRATNLIGILRETDKYGFLRPFFSLHLVKTHRSSSDSPNFQNIPKRDKRISKLVRRAFICRDPNYVMVEIDYGALEFRGAASFWRDPSMVDYASDDSLDIHRDMAAECYMLDRDDVSGVARTFSKNKFVFPILYGSYYVSCARDLWSEIGRSSIKTNSEIPLYDHLKSCGIYNQSDFQAHIKVVEERFNARFPVWSRSKDEWWNSYLERGWFEIPSGFICQGIYSRNNVMNYPIQGPSFHLLLWSLIQINSWLKQNKMKSMVVGQIHDSIRLDIHKSELNEVLAKSKAIMVEEARRFWPWVLTPLIVETEISETNWYEMSLIAN